MNYFWMFATALNVAAFAVDVAGGHRWLALMTGAFVALGVWQVAQQRKAGK